MHHPAGRRQPRHPHRPCPSFRASLVTAWTIFIALLSETWPGPLVCPHQIEAMNGWPARCPAIPAPAQAVGAANPYQRFEQLSSPVAGVRPTRCHPADGGWGAERPPAESLAGSMSRGRVTGNVTRDGDIFSIGYATPLLPDVVGIWSADPDLPILAALRRTQHSTPWAIPILTIRELHHDLSGLDSKADSEFDLIVDLAQRVPNRTWRKPSTTPAMFYRAATRALLARRSHAGQPLRTQRI